LELVKKNVIQGKKKMPLMMYPIFFHAVFQNDGESVDYFLKMDFKADYLDERKRTALHYAAKYGSFESMEVLLKNGANVNAKDLFRQAPLHIAAKHTLPIEADQLDDQNSTAFSVATQSLATTTGRKEANAKCRHFSCLKALINNKADINSKGQFDFTPLHSAVNAGCSACVKYLLAKKADVNAVGQFNKTPLHIAAKLGRLDCLKLLQKKGAKVNAIDTKHQTPLHYAAMLGCISCVEYLLKKNAKVMMRDVDGNTPLNLCNDEECISILVDHIQ
jgi:ankyrin repeat protein